MTEGDAVDILVLIYEMSEKLPKQVKESFQKDIEDAQRILLEENGKSPRTQNQPKTETEKEPIQ